MMFPGKTSGKDLQLNAEYLAGTIDDARVATAGEIIASVAFPAFLDSRIGMIGASGLIAHVDNAGSLVA